MSLFMNRNNPSFMQAYVSYLQNFMLFTKRLTYYILAAFARTFSCKGLHKLSKLLLQESTQHILLGMVFNYSKEILKYLWIQQLSRLRNSYDLDLQWNFLPNSKTFEPYSQSNIYTRNILDFIYHCVNFGVWQPCIVDGKITKH